jgi:thioester reductase-like protein
MTVAEMSAEAALDEQIRPTVGAFGNGRNAITNTFATLSTRKSTANAPFLTGATGFVGAFLLYELLQQGPEGSPASVYCLVRATDAAEGRRRIQANLTAYGLWEDRFDRQVRVVAGDLAQPRFGLAAPAFAALAQQIDGIWHCGAQVKWTYPYRALKAANVQGTHEVLRLACHGRATPVHFISTVGVFSSPHDDRAAALEDDALEESGALTMGYAQSKWIAEKLVRQAGARGLPVTVYRPATAGHSQSGVYNAHDHLPLLIKGCIQLGCAPQLDMVVQVAPIDYVSKAMVWLAGQPGAAGQTYHLVNPHTLLWPELVERIGALGFPLPLVAYDEWQARLAEQVRTAHDQALYGMAPFFAAGGSPLARLPRFDCGQTQAALAPSALVCPPLDGELLNVYFDYFVRSGFLMDDATTDGYTTEINAQENRVTL